MKILKWFAISIGILIVLCALMLLAYRYFEYRKHNTKIYSGSPNGPFLIAENDKAIIKMSLQDYYDDEIKMIEETGEIADTFSNQVSSPTVTPTQTSVTDEQTEEMKIIADKLALGQDYYCTDCLRYVALKIRDKFEFQATDKRTNEPVKFLIKRTTGGGMLTSGYESLVFPDGEMITQLFSWIS